MNADSLAVYLNDHLAGSVAALELIDALAGRVQGTPTEQMLRTVAGHRHPDLDVLEGLETLALGIQGKAALWRALGVIAPENPRLSSFQYSSLEARAQAQYDQVEQARLTAARAALGGG